MANKKITELTALTEADANDLLAIVDDPLGSPITKQITATKLVKSLNNQSATFVVSASNSVHKERADYVCDGVDDQVEIQAALDALSYGGEVKLMEGRYYISASINWPNLYGVSLIGSGRRYQSGTPGGTTLKLDNGANCSVISINTADHLKYVEIKNLHIDGNGAQQGAGNWDCIEVGRSISDSVFEGLSIFSAKRDGIHFTTSIGHNTWNIWLSRILSEVNGNAGFCFMPISFTDHTSLIFMDSCYTYGNLYGIWAQNSKYLGVSNSKIRANKRGNLVLSGCQRGHFCNSVFDKLTEGSDNYDNITLQDLDGTICSLCKFTGCEIGDNQDTPLTRYGINLLDNTDYIQIINCSFIGPLSGAINNVASGTHNRLGYVMHSDLFMDCLAVSATHVVDDWDVSAAGEIELNPAAGNQPDIPRTLSWGFMQHTTVTEFDLVFEGVDAKGNSITETKTEADGWSGETNNAFATISAIKYTRQVGAGDVGNIFDIGITDVLGLSNIIYETGDVFKIKKDNANVAVASAQVNTTYDTYDMSVIGLAATNDFTIWYKSNLNILS